MNEFRPWALAILLLCILLILSTCCLGVLIQ